MDKNYWVRKLSSRKLWLAIAGFVAGLIIFFDGDAETAESVSALIMAGASVLGYIVAEGLSDVSGAKAAAEKTEEHTEE